MTTGICNIERDFPGTLLCWLQERGSAKAAKSNWVDLDDFPDDEDVIVASNQPYQKPRAAPPASQQKPLKTPKCHCHCTCKLVTAESALNYGRCAVPVIA